MLLARTHPTFLPCPAPTGPCAHPAVPLLHPLTSSSSPYEPGRGPAIPPLGSPTLETPRLI